MRLTIFALAPLVVFTTLGCGSGRASDGDVIRLCRLSSRCTGVSEAACQASTESVRDEADRRGCASRFGAVVRCVVSADECVETAECADESEALEECASRSTDAGFTPVDASIALPDAGGEIVPSPVRQGAAGMIEIFHDGEWRPICDDGFSTNEATVACRHLGFSGAGATPPSRAPPTTSGSTTSPATAPSSGSTSAATAAGASTTAPRARPKRSSVSD